MSGRKKRAPHEGGKPRRDGAPSRDRDAKPGRDKRRGRGGGGGSNRRVVVGRRFVVEALRGGTVDRCWVEPGLLEKLPDLADAAAAAGVVIQEGSREDLDRRAQGVRHQGVVASGPPYPYRPLEKLLELDAPLLVALDEVTDPQNFGAIIRSALAFGADGILVPRHRSATLGPAVVRASAGATERAAIAEVPNLQKALLLIADQGLEIIGLDAGGDVLVGDLGPAPRGRVIVVGSEGKGLRRLVRERCDRIASIPQRGDFDSLNASVAAAIALYEAGRTR
ncbi:MAG: 23S rRNA (guanosine(2251)-2'-O)-methyltransferase RlmB [Sandaracinus sp.]|nr:23S rRNA (guanosine(2251)-2'-O)-methyltransferase RlmB [Sandaracinus sp.]